MPYSTNQGRFGSTSGLGSGSPGNGGGRDGAFGAALAQERRRALLEEARRRQANRPKPSPHPANLLPQYTPPAAIFDHAPGLPYYGIAGPTHSMPTRRKAGGYGGVARLSPIPSQTPNV